MATVDGLASAMEPTTQNRHGQDDEHKRGNTSHRPVVVPPLALHANIEQAALDLALQRASTSHRSEPSERGAASIDTG